MFTHARLLIFFFFFEIQDRLPTVKTTPERTVNSSQPSLETIDLDLPFDANSWLEVKEKVNLGVL